MMPNDTANNMVDTIHQLEEDRIMLITQLTALQSVYNEQMLELKKAKRLLKAAVDDLNFESQCRNCKHKEYGLDTVCKECRGNKYEWRYADEFKKLYDPITEAIDEIYGMLGIGQTSGVTASEVAKKSYEYQEPKEYSGLISE